MLDSKKQVIKSDRDSEEKFGRDGSFKLGGFEFFFVQLAVSVREA